MGTTTSTSSGTVFLSAIMLLYPVTLSTGTQSVTANTIICYSDGSDKCKGV